MEQWQQGPAFEQVEIAPPSVEYVPEPGLSVRPFDRDADYPLAAHWWTQHGWAVVPVEALPTLGVIVEVDTGSLEGLQPACCAFMYVDSGWGCVAWVVGDADLPKPIRRVAVDHAIASLTQIGDMLGLALLYTTTPNPAMMDRYTRLGWQDGGDTFRQFVRVNPAVLAAQAALKEEK